MIMVRERGKVNPLDNEHLPVSPVVRNFGFSLC